MRDPGFTLIEILIVLAILAMLMSSVLIFVQQGKAEGYEIETRRRVMRLDGMIRELMRPANRGQAPASRDAVIDALGDRVRGDFVDADSIPIAYFSAAAYKQPGDQDRYRMADGREVTVQLLRDPETGTFANPSTFQLIAAGRDGEFGTADDVTNRE